MKLLELFAFKGEVAWVIRQLALWVFGKAMTSRILFLPARIR
jgi:hypothetical protein